MGKNEFEKQKEKLDAELKNFEKQWSKTLDIEEQINKKMTSITGVVDEEGSIERIMQDLELAIIVQKRAEIRLKIEKKKKEAEEKTKKIKIELIEMTIEKLHESGKVAEKAAKMKDLETMDSTAAANLKIKLDPQIV